MDFVIGIFLLVAAVFLIASVLLQSSKSHKLSGTIVGGAETFFGKTKGATIDRVLSKATVVVAVIFCVLVVVMYVMQDQIDLGSLAGTGESTQDISNVLGNDTTADSDEAGDTTSGESDTAEDTADTEGTTEADSDGESTEGEADDSADSDTADTTSAETQE